MSDNLSGANEGQPQEQPTSIPEGKENSQVVMGGTKGKFVKKGKFAFLAVRQEVIKSNFDQLTDDTRQEWADKAREEAREREQKFLAALRQPPSTEPQARQNAIERLPSFLQPIIDGLAEATGWNFTVICGGPKPADGGRLNIISCHTTTTIGQQKITFGAATRVNYKKYIVPLYANFLQKVYSIDECRRRALPEGSPSLASIINVEADGVDLDTVVLPPKLPAGAFAKQQCNSQAPGSQSGTSKPFVASSSTSSTSSTTTSGATATSGRTKTTTTTGQKATATSSSTSSSASQKSTVTPVNAAIPARRGVPISARMSTGGKLPALPKQPCQPKKPVPPESIPKDRSARYRLAGSSRAADAAEAALASQTPAGGRPRAMSSPPSPSRQQRNPSPASTVPTPPRVTQSPEVASPITVASSPPIPSTAVGSGRQSSPFVLDEHVSPNVVRTYRSLSRKRQASSAKRPAERASSSKRQKASVSDDELVIEGPDREAEGYESDSVFRASTSAKKRVRDRDSENSNQDHASKKARLAMSVSAPVPRTSDTSSLPSTSTSTARSRHNKQKASTASAPPPPPPPPPGQPAAPVDVPTPPSAPVYVEKTLMLARSVGIDMDFRRMLRLWLRIDGAAGFEGNDRLTADYRPVGVQDWIARARSPNYRPDMSDLIGFYDTFLRWFKACMPDWRKDENRGIRLTRDPNGAWETLRKTGPNGIVSFVAVLCW
ncbi:SERTA domain-containing protein 3 [Paramarasmius palmivorus]|uniref:SERTA domain-containing protein 3 n=1 Tax=Paramarasmius palmivorus TaxID=297713 RepID=A0AAW0AW48_9AGAR